MERNLIKNDDDDDDFARQVLIAKQLLSVAENLNYKGFLTSAQS